MADILSTQDDKEKKKATLSTSEGNDLQLGGQPSSNIEAGTNVSGEQAGVKTGERKSSGMGQRLSNLRKYVEANTGSQLGSKLAGRVQEQGNIASSKVGEAQKQVSSDIQAEQQRLQQGQQLIGQDNVFQQGKTQQFLGGGQEYANYGTTPEERLAKFRELQGAVVKAPEIKSQQDIQSEIEKAKKLGEQTQSEQGRYQLLKGAFQKPNYTTGQQRLDQLILQSRPEEIKQLVAQREAYKPAEQQLAALQENVGTQTAALGTQASDIASNISRQLYGTETGPTYDPITGQFQATGGEFGSLASDIQAKTEAARQQSGQRFAELKNKLGAGNISEAELGELGVAPEQAQQLMQINQQFSPQAIKQRIESGNMTDAESKYVFDKMKAKGWDTVYWSPKDLSLGLERLGTSYEDISKQLKPDLSQYINQTSPEQITASRIATPEQIARQQALQQLGGLDINTLGLNPELAGTSSQINPGSIEYNKALSDLQLRLLNSRR